MVQLIRSGTAAMALAAMVLTAGTMAGFAQTPQVAFNGLRQDPTLPVNVTADQLKVNQSDGTAVFSGHVIVGQGKMRLTAPLVRVEYDKTAGGDNGRISKLFASGGVTLNTGTEAAEAKDAVYAVNVGTMVLTGDVLLTQGQNAMSGQKLMIDLTQGTGQMDGRVQTVFQPKSNP
ncbi:LPS-assembly protein LptD [mine drainage metagenome]|uniref:LPS-assembly protein LptD n=1 Tax=mine drainage metagenome TaxID=410659 RepID=A0A1J5PTS0_9ZZZZ